MTNRPNEKEQIQMVVKNLLPIYHKHLFAQYFPNFKDLIVAGTQVEDVVNNGILKNEESYSSKKAIAHTTNEEAVNVVDSQALSIANPRPRRKFSELHIPMGQLFERLIIEGYLNLLDPCPGPSLLPKGYKPHEFCKYHQEPGHQANKCVNLRHAIQNLIDEKVITPPSSAGQSDFA